MNLILKAVVDIFHVSNLSIKVVDLDSEIIAFDSSGIELSSKFINRGSQMSNLVSQSNIGSFQGMNLILGKS